MGRGGSSAPCAFGSSAAGWGCESASRSACKVSAGAGTCESEIERDLIRIALDWNARESGNIEHSCARSARRRQKMTPHTPAGCHLLQRHRGQQTDLLRALAHNNRRGRNRAMARAGEVRAGGRGSGARVCRAHGQNRAPDGPAALELACGAPLPEASASARGYRSVR